MKTAVVLFNLGGPDELGAVKPFLFNLFYDPAIIALPNPARWLLAKWITARRNMKAQKIYKQLGGKSPILEETQAQGQALEQLLKDKGEYKVFTCMRYWNPRAAQVAKNIKAFGAERIILLPLYPQFSSTTTASSFVEWDEAAKNAGLDVPTNRICCYPAQKPFIAAHAKLIRDSYWRAAEHGKPRILFSAHGIPENRVEKGDPYQMQVEKTVAAIMQILTIEDADWRICYQSKVGRLKWLGPSTEEEIKNAGAASHPIVVVPVSFVSEHSETLVELDIDYRKLAAEAGVPDYQRVAALGVEKLFIEALADLCKTAEANETVCSFAKTRYCGREFTGCPSGVAA